MKRVVLGMSGGVDSAAAALLLQERGCEVTAVHLRLAGDGPSAGLIRFCSERGMELVCVDGRELFDREVIRPFVRDYRNGRTPNPCVYCNNAVKWRLLQEEADRRGIAKIATGHYVRILDDNGTPYIHKGKDGEKDQSYFLWGLKKELLARAVTPLGDFTKKEIRLLVAGRGYSAFSGQPESMGVCFLNGMDYREFIRSNAPAGAGSLPGEITDRAGNRLGYHSGLLNYTVGQKREVPLRDGQPMYVAVLDTVAGKLIVDSKEQLFSRELLLGNVHLIDPGDIRHPGLEVKIRGIGQNPEGAVQAEELPDGTLRLRLSSPAWAVAPGQPAALYRQERLLGGGIIIA
ncbi:MAG: tRNA 2-thiouridine(34) synthase MnmA [Culturomica sp.]|jgi:tRNA-specific 2-thiouridylase|nr:tRNA 2-thiouridine(34) synthase MnmA [Culturomica sp.]